MSDRYILDEAGEPIAEPDLMRWGTWMQSADRRIGLDKIGDVSVSTVFLGLDHSFGSGDPVLFETMILGGPHDQYQERYSKRAEAVLGHENAVHLAKGGAPLRVWFEPKEMP